MPPLQSGDSGDAHGEDGDDDQVEFRPPLPPDDRIWRHPSEVATAAAPRNSGDHPAGGRLSGSPRLVGVAALSALIGATLSLGIAAAVGGFDRGTTIVERNVAVRPVTSRSTADDTVAAITARTGPAIAAIRVRRPVQTARESDDLRQTSGSGVVLRSDGYVITNAHLVEGAQAIEVRLHDGRSAEATVVGIDPITDVAVLHVEADDLEPAAMGSADDVTVGDVAIALGAADSGGWSTEVTTGVISGLDRRLGVGDGRVLHDMILVDMPFSPATAGGALLDSHGAVVGITSGIPTTGTGEVVLGAATPIDVAVHVAEQLIAHGRARHVWLGIEGSDLSSDDAVAMTIAGGARVNRVVPDSPAAAGGLEAGDVVVAVGAAPIDSMSDLIASLRSYEPADQITLQVRRGARTIEVVVSLAEREA